MSLQIIEILAENRSLEGGWESSIALKALANRGVSNGEKSL